MTQNLATETTLSHSCHSYVVTIEGVIIEGVLYRRTSPLEVV